MITKSDGLAVTECSGVSSDDQLCDCVVKPLRC